MGTIYQDASQQFAFSQAIRRDLHQHPEMGFKEVRTAGIIANELRALGMEVSTGIAKTGVVALLEGAAPGPTVLIRVDMDALPIQEDSTREYCSLNPGVMHACGHDGHVASGLTVARLLHQHRAEIKGTVKLIFQPAEEGLGGAEMMLAEGILENPKPDYCLALHIWNEKPIGWVGVVDGPLMSGAAMFSIRLTGKGGHGALPHLAVDPIAAAAQIITGIQTIVARNLSPLEAGVVTVAQIHAGETFNVIPKSVEIKGTIRAFEPAVRERIVERFKKLVLGISDAMGCEAEVEVGGFLPAVINDAKVAQRIAVRVRQELPQAELDTKFRTMVSEDMAHIMQKVPGCYLMVGGANSEKGLDYPHHHPRFDFDEDALVYAAATVTSAALELLS